MDKQVNLPKYILFKGEVFELDMQWHIGCNPYDSFHAVYKRVTGKKINRVIETYSKQLYPAGLSEYGDD